MWMRQLLGWNAGLNLLSNSTIAPAQLQVYFYPASVTHAKMSNRHYLMSHPF